jgi:phage-related protein
MSVGRKPLHFLGSSHSDLKAFPEEARRDASGAYCVIYLATRLEAAYVLHCFQKKAEKTSQRDVDLARQRFKAIPKPKQARK